MVNEKKNHYTYQRSNTARILHIPQLKHLHFLFINQYRNFVHNMKYISHGSLQSYYEALFDVLDI
jgi:hypothetical protein